MVEYGIRQATETIQQMTSVEHILQYTDLESVKLLIKIKCSYVILNFYSININFFFVFLRNFANRKTLQIKHLQMIGHVVEK